MPTYLPARGGVTLSQAYAQAAAIASADRVLLDTLSFSHPTIGAATELRLVGDHQDLEATIEAGAPIQAGQAVTFTRCGFSLQRPPEADTEVSPQLRIGLVGISQEVARALDTAVTSGTPVTVTHRVYASDDTTAPAVLPVLRMDVVSAEVTDTAVVIVCQYRDPANTAFPRVTYTRAQYPTLSAS